MSRREGTREELKTRERYARVNSTLYIVYVYRKSRITLNKDGKEGRRGRNFPSSSFLVDNGVTSKQWMTTHPHFQYIMNLAHLIPFYSSRSHVTHSIIPSLSNPLTPFSILPQSILRSRFHSTHGIYGQSSKSQHSSNSPNPETTKQPEGYTEHQTTTHSIHPPQAKYLSPPSDHHI